MFLCFSDSATPRIPIYGVIQDLMTAFEETPQKLPLVQTPAAPAVPEGEQTVKEEMDEEDDDKPRGSPLRPTRYAAPIGTNDGAEKNAEKANSGNDAASVGSDASDAEKLSEHPESAVGLDSENEDEKKEEDQAAAEDNDKGQETNEDRQKDEGEVEAVVADTFLDTVPAQASQVQVEPRGSQIAQEAVVDGKDWQLPQQEAKDQGDHDQADQVQASKDLEVQTVAEAGQEKQSELNIQPEPVNAKNSAEAEGKAESMPSGNDVSTTPIWSAFTKALREQRVNRWHDVTAVAKKEGTQHQGVTAEEPEPTDKKEKKEKEKKEKKEEKEKKEKKDRKDDLKKKDKKEKKDKDRKDTGKGKDKKKDKDHGSGSGSKRDKKRKDTDADADQSTKKSNGKAKENRQSSMSKKQKVAASDGEQVENEADGSEPTPPSSTTRAPKGKTATEKAKAKGKPAASSAATKAKAKAKSKAQAKSASKKADDNEQESARGHGKGRGRGRGRGNKKAKTDADDAGDDVKDDDKDIN